MEGVNTVDCASSHFYRPIKLAGYVARISKMRNFTKFNLKTRKEENWETGLMCDQNIKYFLLK